MRVASIQRQLGSRSSDFTSSAISFELGAHVNAAWYPPRSGWDRPCSGCRDTHHLPLQDIRRCTLGSGSNLTVHRAEPHCLHAKERAGAPARQQAAQPAQSAGAATTERPDSCRCTSCRAIANETAATKSVLTPTEAQSILTAETYFDLFLLVRSVS